MRQFDLAGVDCTSLAFVLLNDVHACTGENLTVALCAAGLRWSSRTDVEVLGRSGRCVTGCGGPTSLVARWS